MTPKRFAIFIGISFLLHLLLLILITVGWLNLVQWNPEPAPPEPVRLTLKERPPAPLPEPLQRERPFVDTSDSVKADEPDPNAALQGAENTVAMSSQAGAENNPLPNLTGEKSDALNLRDSPYSPQTRNQPSQPSPEQKQQQEQREEPNRKEDDREQEEKKESRPNSLTRSPQGLLLTREEEQKRQELLEKKRRELEALDASQSSPPPMAFSAERRQSRLPGGAEIGPTDSFGAEQTDLGRYKQKLYRAIGSRWYIYVEQSRGLVSLGKVRIRFFVRADGVFEQIQVISGDRNSQLYVISRRSIMENSGQLEPFSEKMRQQLGDGYWEEISFTIH